MRAWHFAAPLLCCLFAQPVMANSDGDGDGVPDFKDACPDTLQGVSVGADGCAAKSEETEVIAPLCMLTVTHQSYPAGCSGAEIPKLYFEFASSFVPLETAALLSQVADLIKGQEVTLLLRGHTDIIGSREANWLLARERAENVAAVLSGDFGIERHWILLESLGATEPAASNDTPMGRQQNRRVEILVQIK